jgi:hypothetical protein
VKLRFRRRASHRIALLAGVSFPWFLPQFVVRALALQAEGGSPTPSPTPTPTSAAEGYDGFTALGDSYIAGRGNFEADRDPVRDAVVPDTAQWINRSDEVGYQTISTNTAPIWNPDDGVERVSPLESLLRGYQSENVARGRKAFIIPCGVGGTRLIHTASTSDWDPAGPGDQLVTAKNTHNSAYAELRASHPGSRMRGVMVCLTTNDVVSGTYDTTNIRAAWIALAVYIRANFDGVDDETPIVFSGPSCAGAGYNTARADIAYAVSQVDNCYYVEPPTPTTDPGNLHPTMDENAIWGAAVGAAFWDAPEPEIVEDFAITAANDAPLNTPIDSEPVLVMVGYGVAVTASIVDGTFSVNGGAFDATAKSVAWGDEIVVRRNSALVIESTTTATLTIGTKSAPFNITTVAPKLRFTNPGVLVQANGLTRFATGNFILETA